MKLAQGSTSDIFGQITPQGPNVLSGDPVVGLGKLLAFMLNMIFIVAGITMLIYMLWGAYNWISSSGDPEHLAKARSRIATAFWGMLTMVAVLTIFGLITGNILGIIQINSGGWKFKLPVLSPPDPYSKICSKRGGSCVRIGACAGGHEASGTDCDTSPCGGLGCTCCIVP